ncbi:MAG: hypothetical protein WC400_00240 [Patescibacteria group bacterium]|jgi:cell wall-associated NlpC family hydrolase
MADEVGGIQQWSTGSGDDDDQRQQKDRDDSNQPSNTRRQPKKKSEDKPKKSDQSGKPTGKDKDDDKKIPRGSRPSGADKKASGEPQPKPAPTTKPAAQPSGAGSGAGQAGKAVGEAAGKARAGAEAAARPAVEAGRQAAVQATARLAEAAARIAAEVAAKVAKATEKIVQAVVKFLSNPYVLAAVLVIVIVMVLFNIFMGSVNQISSLAGGSIFVPADHNNPAHQQIVNRLKEKMSGCDPKLVVYDGGISDIDWQVDPTSGGYTHKLDIRLLKTLDYLTDKHRIRIDLLKTGAPDLVRDLFLKKKAQYSSTGQDEVEQKETLSAFTTGQAMAIVEIDRTKIPELQSADVACNAPVPAPIEVGWQRTVGEKTIRPIWEELAYDVGFLDKNYFIYQGVAGSDDQMAIQRVARAYKLSEPVDGAYDLYKETFNKLPRIVDLIDRALVYGQNNFSGDQALDSRALAYLQKARESYASLVTLVSGINSGMAEEEIAETIKELGADGSLATMRTGARFVYKATQVKNSVNWAKKKKNGDLTWIKADESRNKIRQVLAELLVMPRDTSLEGTPKLFDSSLVAKQIITFSPEDDLDNGLENVDVFPRGIVSVNTGGVAMETLSVDSTTGNAVGNGLIDYADSQFSHAPIDNGTFSKNGANYIYKQVRPEDSTWEKVGAFVWNYLTMPGQLSSANDKLHELTVGGCVSGMNESCRKVSYKDFLYVAF